MIRYDSVIIWWRLRYNFVYDMVEIKERNNVKKKNIFGFKLPVF